LLSEVELSEMLGLSRTPIREVLTKLKSEHLIETKAHIGTYISLIDFNLIEEAMFMRYSLEKEVLKEACKNFNDDILMDLERNLFAQKLIVDKSKFNIEFHRLDEEFHELLYRGVNKINVWNRIVNISTHYNRMRILSEMSSDKTLIIKQHEAYLELIKNKSLDKINEVITQHIKEPTIDWRDIIESEKY
ncbi:MAG: GntR family transcriptional regulator, partial [Peptostreptococcaceae bacterium]